MPTDKKLKILGGVSTLFPARHIAAHAVFVAKLLIRHGTHGLTFRVKATSAPKPYI